MIRGGEKVETSSDAPESEVGPPQVKDAKGSEVRPTQVRVSGAKDSEVDPAEVSGDGRKVHECAKAGDEKQEKNKNCCLNVLLFGHSGAGKKMAIRTLLENHLNNIKRSERLGKVPSRHMAHSLGKNEEELTKDNEIKFKIQCHTETAKFYFSAASSSFDFVSGSMRKALQADIAVLFISGRTEDLKDNENSEQTYLFLLLIIALCIPRIVVVVSKLDEPTCTEKSYGFIKSKIESAIKAIGSTSTKIVEILPISFKSGLNMQTKLGDKCNWWNGPCLFDVLEAIEVPVRPSSIFLCTSNGVVLEWIKKLVGVDLELEVNPTNSGNWFERAKILAILKRFPEAFEAASKASENPSDCLLNQEDSSPFFALIRGHQLKAKGNINSALKYYRKAKNHFKSYGDKALGIITNIISEATEKEEMEEEKNSSVSRSEAGHDEDHDGKKDKIRGRSTRKSSVSRSKAGHHEDHDEKKDKISSVSRSEARHDADLDEKRDESSSVSRSEARHDADLDEKRVESSLVSRSEARHDANLDEKRDESRPFKLQLQPQNIEDASISSNYKLETVLHGVYSGYKFIECINVKIPKSFIMCSKHQIKNYERLEVLGLNGANILKVDDVENFKNEPYFVVGQVKTLDVFFAIEQQKYFSHCQRGMTDSKSWTDDVKAEHLKKWWQFIEVKFKKIFRGVVDGLLFLNSMDYTCGNLSFSIYITVEEHARLLPSMDSNATQSNDIHDLVKCMKGIVYSICPNLRVPPNWVESDLNHIFSFLTPKKLTNVPFRCLLFHHFFLSSRERVQFIYNLRRIISMNIFRCFDTNLEKAMTKNDQTYFWPHKIPEGVVAYEIWKMGDPDKNSSDASCETDKQKLKESGWVQVQPYNRNRDIIRYMVAVYTHYNGSEYSKLRKEFMDAVAIERLLLGMFPNIYCHIMDALHANFIKMPSEIVNGIVKDLAPHFQ